MTSSPAKSKAPNPRKTKPPPSIRQSTPEIEEYVKSTLADIKHMRNMDGSQQACETLSTSDVYSYVDLPACCSPEFPDDERYDAYDSESDMPELVGTPPSSRSSSAGSPEQDSYSPRGKTQSLSKATSTDNTKLKRETEREEWNELLPDRNNRRGPRRPTRRTRRNRKSRNAVANRQASVNKRSSQAALLGRHEHCICPIEKVETGMPPNPPEHAWFSAYMLAETEKLMIKEIDDGKYLLLDNRVAVWYIISLRKEGIKLVASNSFIPWSLKLIKDLFKSYDCPCFDEIHGQGVSAKIARAVAAHDALYTELELITASLCMAASKTGTGGHENKDFYILPIVLKGKYLNSFPWLDKSALDEKVNHDCRWIKTEYKNTLNGVMMHIDIVRFYGAEDFIDAKESEFPKHRNILEFPPTLGPDFEKLKPDHKPLYPEAAAALQSKFVDALPWMGKDTALKKAEYDVFWLHDVTQRCTWQELVLTDEDIVKFYGAEKWYTAGEGNVSKNILLRNRSLRETSQQQSNVGKPRRHSSGEPFLGRLTV